MATLSVLKSVLLPFHRKMLLLGGIVWTASKGIRQLDRGFYGAGLLHPDVEAIVKQSNKLLMHYSCQSSLGIKLQMSLGLLLVELGMSFQPLKLSYNKFGDMVITSWLKRVWEKLDRFKFAVTVHNLCLVFPREDNDWLMAWLIAIGYKGNSLRMLDSGVPIPNYTWC
jgi:hypothetical protein